MPAGSDLPQALTIVESLVLIAAAGSAASSSSSTAWTSTATKLACSCGVTFERWVTAQDAVVNLLKARLGAERN